MTRQLEEAFCEASQLSDEEQDRFAQFVRAELHSEKKWAESFAKSQDKLSRLAQAALEEHRRGETKSLD